MLRTVTKNSPIIITKHTWYHRYREIIKTTGGPPLHYGSTGSQIRRREGENWNALMSHQRCLDWCRLQIILSVKISAILNDLPLLGFLLAQDDMVVCHSWRNFNKIIPFSSGIILCSHLFTCFCMGSTDFRSTRYAQVMPPFRSFRSV